MAIANSQALPTVIGRWLWRGESLSASKELLELVGRESNLDKSKVEYISKYTGRICNFYGLKCGISCVWVIFVSN